MLWKLDQTGMDDLDFLYAIPGRQSEVKKEPKVGRRGLRLGRVMEENQLLLVRYEGVLLD
jgi:hypothetical protein